jgi:hypothetical protein
MANYKNSILGAKYTVSEAAAAELDGPGEVNAEALALAAVAGVHGVVTDSTEFTYSATAVDNGIAGDLSGQPGIIFEGPAGLYTVTKVKVTNLHVSEGSIAVPDAEDTVTIGLYVNSALWAIAEEGFSPDESMDTETGVEFNISETDLALTELDVIRVALVGVDANEELLDFDIDAQGTVEIK